MSWGDVATAFHSTGIPNIEVYFEASPPMMAFARTPWFVKSFLGLDFMQHEGLGAVVETRLAMIAPAVSLVVRARDFRAVLAADDLLLDEAIGLVCSVSDCR